MIEEIIDFNEFVLNISRLTGGFYGIVIIEGDLTATFHGTSDLETKKKIIEDAQDVVTSTRAMIEEVTTINKCCSNLLLTTLEGGKKHAVQEHLKLRERILISMEAYIISIESKLTELKNEI